MAAPNDIPEARTSLYVIGPHAFHTREFEAKTEWEAFYAARAVWPEPRPLHVYKSTKKGAAKSWTA